MIIFGCVFSVFIFIALIILIFLLIFLYSSIYLVQQAEAIVVERLGRYHKVLLPGLHCVIPFIESPHVSSWTFVYRVDSNRYVRQIKELYRLDVRESVHDFPKQNVITRDNVNIEINALLYYQIIDPRAAVYEVANLPEAIEKLTQTTLRNVIGSMDLDEALMSRDRINAALRSILDEAIGKWGVRIDRVELQEINPPHDVQLAMEKQMRAERDRRAIILEAEGQKRSSILKAEGEQESLILRARGAAEAKILESEGIAQARLRVFAAEAESILMIQKVINGNDPLPYLIAREYIKVLPEMLKDKESKVIVVPYEASSLVGSLTSIKTLFDNIK